MTSETTKRVLLWGGTAIGLGLMVWGLANVAAPTAPTTSGAALSSAVDGKDHMQGSTIAKVTLVEYSDFQCPACAGFEPTVQMLKKKYGGQVLFVYRHYPLPQHIHADLAARASEAAANQGKFWEMHELLFGAQTTWSPLSHDEAQNAFIKMAEALKLDVARFTKDLDTQAAKDRIDRDVQSGNASGVDSTPSFYLNGKKITGLQTYADLENLIISALNETK